MTEDALHLLHGYLNGTTSAEDLPRLQSLLRESADARRIFRTLSTVDSKWLELASADAVTAQWMAPAREKIVSDKPRMHWFGWFHWRPLAAAAAVLIGFVIWFTQSPMATLASVRGDVRVWRAQKTMIAKLGFVLQAGDWLLTGGDGAAEIHFPGETTRLSIGANAEFGVVTAKPGKQLKLTAGMLTASVARQSASHPMLIRTPTAKAEVLGTKFEMSADKAITLMKVEEGRVLIARESDESGVIVEATQSATVTATAPVSVISSLPAQSLANALMAHWKLDGDGADMSGNGNALTLSSGVLFSEGRIGKALDLHAAKVDVESPRLVFPPVFTVAMWLRLNPGEARIQPLIGCDGQQTGADNFWLLLPPNFPGSGIMLNVRGHQMGSQALARKGVVFAGQWHHLAVVTDSAQGSASFFVDGHNVTAVAGLRRDFRLEGPLLIGRRVKSSSLPFDGQLDDIRIYGRALSTAEISALAEGNAEAKQSR